MPFTSNSGDLRWQVTPSLIFSTPHRKKDPMQQDRKSSLLTSGAALLLLLSFTACGGDDGGGGTSAIWPTVIANTPLSGALDAPLNGSVSATFSEPMDAATLTNLTFTLAAGAVAVPGTVSYTHSKAEFRPTTLLVKNTLYTATLTTGVKSAKGVALAANYYLELHHRHDHWTRT